MTRDIWPRWLLAASVALLASACTTLGPDYHAPRTAPAAQWQATLPHQGRLASLLDWWQQLDDPVLHQLLTLSEQHHPTLDSALAAIDSARADLDSARLAGLPTLDSSASALRQGGNHTLGSALDASWELDLWGSVRRQQEAASARLSASEAQWHDARASLAAELASNYVNYRACQLQSTLAGHYRLSQQDSRDATRRLTASGLAAGIDSAAAEAELASAIDSQLQQQASCTLYVKALVNLSGLGEPALRSLLDSQPPTLPDAANLAVDSLPAALLSQRPDLVAAERQLAAASADIGIADAQRYPRLALSGSLSAQRNSSSWSLGPTLSLPLLDGGSSQAAAVQARASYRSALASYQSAVAKAVQEVEQALVRLDSSQQRETVLAGRSARQQQTLAATTRQWHNGGASVLELGTALRNSISAEQDLITLRRDHLLYTLTLYKALGGGWGESAPHGASRHE